MNARLTNIRGLTAHIRRAMVCAIAELGPKVVTRYMMGDDLCERSLTVALRMFLLERFGTCESIYDLVLKAQAENGNKASPALSLLRNILEQTVHGSDGRCPLPRCRAVRVTSQLPLALPSSWVPSAAQCSMDECVEHAEVGMAYCTGHLAQQVGGD